MNKIIVGNALTASLAMTIGFYAGTRWHDEDRGKEQLAVEASPAAVTLSQETAPSPPEHGPGAVTVAPFAATQGAGAQQSPSRREHRPPQVAQTEKTQKDRQPSWEPVVSGFDREKLEQTYQQLQSQDANQRHEALRTLAQLGAEEIKPDLIRIASDEEENSEVRRDLIQQINWSGNTQELTEILRRSRDSEIRLAAVTAVASGKLTDTERVDLERVMLENFRMEPQDGIKIATLNHFLASDPIAFQQIIEQFPNEISSPEVQSYLQLITTPPDETAQAPQEVEGSGG